MSVRKTIQINPEFLKMNKSKKRRKRKKPAFSTTLKPNNIKKQLMQRIKEHQQKVKDDNTKPDNDNEKFRTDFKTSLTYLQKMIGEKKKRKHRQRHRRRGQHTMRNNNNDNIPTGNINIMTHVSGSDPILPNLSQKPKWGCLKGGTLPTWRQYQRTLKKKEKCLKIPPIQKPTRDILDRQNKLSRIKNRIRQEKKILTPLKRELVTTTRTLKIFKLGKKNNKVGVLIKSGKTRKIIKNEVNVLKERSVVDIKKYLRKHNLIKSGSGAPENILRKIYEDSYLAGDIYNKNPDHLIHNYIHNH